MRSTHTRSSPSNLPPPLHSGALYGCEAWALTRDLYRSILSFHNLCVRKMNRITLEQTEQPYDNCGD